MTEYWVVRQGRGGIYTDEMVQSGYLGVNFVGDYDIRAHLGNGSRAFHTAMNDVYLHLNPSKSKIAAGLAMGNLWAACEGIHIGDVVLAPKPDRTYAFGTVTGGYEYVPGTELPHRRQVDWKGSMAESHLFVTKGKLLRLRCDAWMVPTDKHLNISAGWTEKLRAWTMLRTQVQTCPFEMAGQSPLLHGHGPLMSRFLCSPLSQRMEFARLLIWSPELRRSSRRPDNPSSNGGPPFHKGHAGTTNCPSVLWNSCWRWRLQRGEIMHAILSAIWKELPLLKCDVVLVLQDESAFALAQDLRRKEGGNSWSGLAHEQF